MSKLYPEYCYRDVAIGHANQRNNVMTLTELAARWEGLKRDCYATVCRFPDAYREYWEGHGRSVKGYEGAAFADYLWFDIDDADLEESLRSTLNLLRCLSEFFRVDPLDVRVYFTGKKGFHVGIPSATFGAEPGPLLPRAFKVLAHRLASQAGVTLDESIYRHNSLLRLPNTVNGKSGLYKYPLTCEEVGRLLMGEIRALAADRRMESIPRGPEAFNDVLASLYKQAAAEAEEQSRKKSELPVLNDFGEGEMPRFDKVCIYRMLKGVPNGQRNEVCLRLAVHFRQKGFPLTTAQAALLDWNHRNETALDEVDVLDVARRCYDASYDFGCHDPILDRYCHNACHLYPNKMGTSETLDADVLDVNEARARYMAYIQERSKAKVSWGIPWLDNHTRGLAPGQVGLLMARAGVGKTALVLNTLKANSNLGIPSLFCSLEQLTAEVFERMAQSATGITGDRIEEAFYSHEDLLIRHVSEAVTQEYQHAYICDRDRLTVEQLKAYVRAAERKSGQRIRLLVVDYMGRMRGEGREAYQQASSLAIGLKEVAKECELAVLAICQVNRSGGTGNKEVTLDMGRDSGQIEECVDVAVGMWRANGNDQGAAMLPLTQGGGRAPEDGPGYYPVLLQINKNRKGGAGLQQCLIFRADVMQYVPLSWLYEQQTARREGDAMFDGKLVDPATGEITDACV